jgi:hypothetical protein
MSYQATRQCLHGLADMDCGACSINNCLCCWQLLEKLSASSHTAELLRLFESLSSRTAELLTFDRRPYERSGNVCLGVTIKLPP